MKILNGTLAATGTTMKVLAGVLALACVVALAYLIGRIARKRGWTAKKAQLCCFAAGWVVMPAAGAIVDSRVIFFMAPVVWLLGWFVCARIAGFSLNQPRDEAMRPVTLGLSKDAAPEKPGAGL